MTVFSHQLASPLDDLPKLDFPKEDVSLVFVHASPFALEDPMLLSNFRNHFPNAKILGCSSSGEILNGEGHNNTIIFSALAFEKSEVKNASIRSNEHEEDEFEGGRSLAKQLDGENLQLIVLFCEGLGLDCDQFIAGVRDGLSKDVAISGGLAGDNLQFEHTVILDRDGVYDNGVVAVGIYSDALEVNLTSSVFDMPGIDLEITKSDGNVMLEINGKPAYDEFCRLLGDNSEQLPGICLSFPFIILDPETREPLYCRTVHEIIENQHAILAAGSVPQGPARLINLQDTAVLFENAQSTVATATNNNPEFAFIINCAGRRAALGDAWIDELDVVRKAFSDVPNSGFYSYGEIGNRYNNDGTIVHNHTINIFTLHEA